MTAPTAPTASTASATSAASAASAAAATATATPRFVDVQRDGRVATVRLQRPPANAIHGPLLTELIAAIDELEGSDVDGFVLLGRPGLFSAGLDLPTLLQLDRDGMAAFWRDFSTTFLRLWQTELCMVAAIEGHAPAGGTVLCLAADHRVMADGPYRMGLNEVAVGLAVPRFLCQVAVARLGQRNAERLLTTGSLVTPAEALAAGFVDEVVAQDDVVATSIAMLQARLAVPDKARRATKAALRAPLGDAIARGNDTEIESFLESWFAPHCQRELRATVERFARRKEG